LIAGVAASLIAIPGLEIVHVNTDAEALSECVRSVKPDLVIFELDRAWAQYIAALIQDQPRLTLVGLHPEYNRLIEVKERHHCLVTMEDLIAILESTCPQRAAAPDKL
jgi:hypothetical protein